MTVVKDLLDSVDITPKDGEAQNDFLKRLSIKVHNLPDDDWDVIPEVSQKWVIDALEASERGLDVELPEGVEVLFPNSDEPEELGDAANNSVDVAIDEQLGDDGGDQALSISDALHSKELEELPLRKKSKVNKVPKAPVLKRSEVVVITHECTNVFANRLLEIAALYNSLAEEEAQIHSAEALYNKLSGAPSSASVSGRVTAKKSTDVVQEPYVQEPYVQEAHKSFVSNLAHPLGAQKTPKSQRELVLGVLADGPQGNAREVSDAINSKYGVKVSATSLSPLISGLISKKILVRGESGIGIYKKS